MLQLTFAGWFQCRLATDPDPYDETRGVSGYVKAYAGEPDLDRILSWQKPAFERPHGPAIGVAVRDVSVDGRLVEGHRFAGARVELLERPVFEGRNGVVAEDGLEPIYPFVLQVRTEAGRLRRAVAPADPSFPFEELFAKGVEGGPAVAAEVMRATGYALGLAPVWQERLEKLEADLATAGESAKPGIKERIRFVSSTLANPPGATRFFGVRMSYEYELNSTAEIEDPDRVLGNIDPETPWRAAFWLGGWDADALCGYARGALAVPYTRDPEPRFSPRGRRP